MLLRLLSNGLHTLYSMYSWMTHLSTGLAVLYSVNPQPANCNKVGAYENHLKVIIVTILILGHLTHDKELKQKAASEWRYILI